MAYQMRGSGRKSKEDIMLKRKKVKPITLRDVTIIDDGKLRKR
jgi:hypothetical protein